MEDADDDFVHVEYEPSEPEKSDVVEVRKKANEAFVHHLQASVEHLLKTEWIGERYNPDKDEGCGLAAKIWELLRRNSDFRLKMAEIEGRFVAADDHPQRFADLDTEICQTLGLNPFAGYAMIWAGRHRHYEFQSFREPVFWSRRWGRADQVLDLHLLPERRVLQLELLLSHERAGKISTAPLSTSSTLFNLKTPWPDTPALFRYHYEWLWESLEFGLNGILDADEEEALFRNAKVGTVDSKTFIKGWKDAAGTIGREVAGNALIDLLENHWIFAVPKVLLSQQDKKRLREGFDAFLELREVHSGKKAVFGSEVQWDLYSYAQERLQAGTGADVRGKTEQVKHILVDFRKVIHPAGPRSNIFHQDLTNFKQMGDLSDSLFDEFDFGRILRLHKINCPPELARHLHRAWAEKMSSVLKRCVATRDHRSETAK